MRHLRDAIPLLALLLIGAAINFVVSVVPTMFESMRVPSAGADISESPARWPYAVPADWPTPTNRARVESAAWTYERTSAEAPGTSRPQCEINWWSSGFPMRSFQAFWLVDRRSEPPSGQFGAVVHGALDLPKSFATRVGTGHIFYLPRWPGFAVNTLLYAAAAWGCFAALIYWRRCIARRRLANGQCPKCRYPVAGLDRCPECGAALTMPDQPRAHAAAS